MQTGHILRLFLASPSDVANERQEAIDSLLRVNAMYLASKLPIAIQPVMWETHAAAGLGGDPQSQISPLIDDCDILIGIFWSRLGTKTPRAKSGTVEEISAFIEKRGGKRALLFFCERAPDSAVEKLDVKQIKSVQSFARDMKAKGLCIAFKSVEDFGKKLQHQLHVTLAPMVEDLRLRQVVDVARPKDHAVSKERLALVAGRWVGTGRQDVMPDGAPPTFKVRMSLEVVDTSITGSADLSLSIKDRPAQLMLMIKGRFENDRYLRLNFTSNVPGATHFGTFILKMNALGTELDGQYLGYGAYNEELVWGELTVQKTTKAD
jgi:Domain of unknown function (DUF4062)